MQAKNKEKSPANVVPSTVASAKRRTSPTSKLSEVPQQVSSQQAYTVGQKIVSKKKLSDERRTPQGEPQDKDDYKLKGMIGGSNQQTGVPAQNPKRRSASKLSASASEGTSSEGEVLSHVLRSKLGELSTKKEKGFPRASQQRFRVLPDQRLGVGAFGVVYKGFDEETGGMVAVKTAAVRVGSEQALAAEFSTLTQLQHPHIVQVYHFCVDSGEARLFMEWMSSGSVKTVLDTTGSRLHELTLRRYSKESLLGLQYLHEKSIVHRDIKPENMLVSGTGVVKLSDFGTSKLHEQSATTMHVVGTIPYMAPECLRRGKYSSGSDIWAWACSVVYMATNSLPWCHLPVEQQGQAPLVFHIGSAQPPDHHPVIPSHLSAALRSLLLLCFSYEAVARPTAANLLADAYFALADLPQDAESMHEFQEKNSKNMTVLGTTSTNAMTGPSSSTFQQSVVQTFV